MRRLANLVFLLFLVAPVPSRAQTCEFLVCQPVLLPNGTQKEQAVFYYHVDAAAPVFTLRNEYFNGIVTLPPNPPQNYQRLIHEFRLPVVLSTCQKQHTNFESAHGWTRGSHIDGELWELEDAGTGAVIGTVFIDDPSTGVEARGGVMGAQKFYDCTDASGPHALLQNVSMFNPGFDGRAIDVTTQSNVKQKWLNPIQAQINAAAHEHVVSDTKRSCVEISIEDYGLLLTTPGVDCSIEYDFGDPGGVSIAIPPS